ncbi:MAG: hypothetical protein DRP63_01850 [Planctomycetota bacterium]|nr:MAG: hypothetical protein DRP63_01850 [Planctomycetota bacterium]
MKWLIRIGACVALHLCEAALFGPYQPQTAAAFATHISTRVSREGGLLLFLVWGLLRDATSAEHPGVFLVAACAAWTTVAALSYILRPTLPVLLAIHTTALIAARLSYVLLASLSNHTLLPANLLPFILRTTPAALIVFLLTQPPPEEARA